MIGKSDFLERSYELASNGDSVVVKLTLKELISMALPMTKWAQQYLYKDDEITEDYKWLIRVVVTLQNGDQRHANLANFEESWDIFRKNYNYNFNRNNLEPSQKPLLWSINKNRSASLALSNSVPATKADAARRLFDIDGDGINWAILDSGIDASHPAFRKIETNTGKPYKEAFGPKEDLKSNHTRIVASYDFTRFREVISQIATSTSAEKLPLLNSLVATSNTSDQGLGPDEVEEYISEIRSMIRKGRNLDWTIIVPLLRIPHNDTEYLRPKNSHGTHVAGIIGAAVDDTASKLKLFGMCPGITLYDIRVMDDQGKGEEFNILAAMQFLRWLNSERDEQTIHGINMSISLVHEVASYACGHTPICSAAERLVAEGTVVVAAAGNMGQSIFQGTDGSTSQGFRMVNITDPGNAEKVITVGSTHRNRPHTYGVSYFSSKGPTGDGRLKPDLVAPGEKIESACNDGTTETRDGTSMAAPHVSGAAALLLAKQRELIGSPDRVKKILCDTCTDIGREKYFQGHGMVDVLRALQSI